MADLQLSRTEHLRDFLRRSAGLPFVWGERDCALWVSEWLQEARGVDPGAAIRGRYRTELGCARLLRRGGGMEAMMREHLNAAGLRETDAPAPGDVGLVHDGKVFVLAICVASGWMAKSPRGIVAMPIAVMRAWAV